VRRLVPILLFGAALAACASTPAPADTDAPATPTPAAQITSQEAAYLAAIEPLPNLLGPDVAAYNTECSANLATSACLQTLDQFGSDMDGFLSSLPNVVVPAVFQTGNTALKKALADLVGTLATLVVAINDNSPGVEDDAGGAVSAEGEIFPALGVIADEQKSIPATTFTSADHTFSTTLPTGWSNVTGDTSLLTAHHLTGAEFVAIQWDYLSASAGITVAYVSAQEVTPPLTEAQIAPYLKTVVGGVTLLTRPAKFTLDGSDGLFDTSSATNAGNEYEAQDMVIDHGGKTFEIVITVLRSAFPQELVGFNAIMNAWRWTAS
jgi:hypothetical protein